MRLHDQIEIRAGGNTVPMSRRASIGPWLAVMAVTVMTAMFAMWLEQQGAQDLGFIVFLIVIVQMVWLFERV